MPAKNRPRWFLRPPTDGAVAAFLAEQKDVPFSYPEVGESLAGSPRGYSLDHNRVLLGRGEPTFARACSALNGWRMFPPAWTRIVPANAPIGIGKVVAMQAHALGVYWLNACRIVYVLSDTPATRVGFAYGTLEAHVEQGEERFSVELLADGSVYYDLRAFSRPRYWPVRIGKPVARRLQRRFVRDSQRAMLEAVTETHR